MCWSTFVRKHDVSYDDTASHYVLSPGEVRFSPAHKSSSSNIHVELSNLCGTQTILVTFHHNATESSGTVNKYSYT